jgi:hypothetical protein
MIHNEQSFIERPAKDHELMPGINKIMVLIAEIIAGAAIVLILYGLYNGFIGSFIAIPEATGVWLVLFFIMLAIIDIFLIVYTLRAWEME